MAMIQQLGCQGRVRWNGANTQRWVWRGAQCGARKRRGAPTCGMAAGSMGRLGNSYHLQLGCRIRALI